MRPGLIIRGICVMAPSSLDTTRDTDRSFADRCKNGLIIMVDNEQPQMVVAYHEPSGSVLVRDTDEDGRPTGALSCRQGRVRAIPGTR